MNSASMSKKRGSYQESVFAWHNLHISGDKVILNISGRTDIVAFYSGWLMNRLDEGFIDVRNPFNPKMVSRIMMDDVDLLFFCTKNPMPILDKLKDVKKKVYFHVTLTSYKKDIEPNIPQKKMLLKL